MSLDSGVNNETFCDLNANVFTPESFQARLQGFKDSCTPVKRQPTLHFTTLMQVSIAMQPLGVQFICAKEEVPAMRHG